MKGTTRRQNSPDSREIIRWLTERIAKIIGCAPEDIDADVLLDGIGLSSRDAMGLSGELEEWLGCRLEPTLLLDHPTIASVAGHLSGETQSKHNPLSLYPKEADPVAIVGMACRWPGAPDKDAYWRLMMEKTVALKSWPPERLRLTGQKDLMGTDLTAHACRWGGFLDDIEMFDAEFFRLSPREAVFMDPRQRLMLETVWTALEDAGCVPEVLSGSKTGVYMAAGQGEYAECNPDVFRNAALSDVMGAALCAIANRVSHFLGLCGPSLTLDAACAGSLYAVHLACQALDRREIDMAIVGSVNLLLDPCLSAPLAKAGLLSPDGVCRPFDTQAAGYVRGEGCAVVILRRFRDANEAQEHIYALIRGGATGHAGRGWGLTSSSTGAYADVIRNALAVGSVNPSELGYIEAHGAAMLPVDLMELNAFVSIGVVGARKVPCYIGTHKSNIGNSEVTSGMAGLIRTALILEHGVIPPQASFDSPDPRSPIGKEGLAVAQTSVPWPDTGTKRFAAILSQGLAGSNAALVLEEGPRTTTNLAVTGSSQDNNGFVLSARTPRALGILARRMAEYLNAVPHEELRNASKTINRGRTKFNCRAIVSGTDRDSLVASLLEVARNPEAAIAVAVEQDRGSIPGETGAFKHIPLPGYPFERVRHWLEPDGRFHLPERQSDSRIAAAAHDLNIRDIASSLQARFVEYYLRETIASILQMPMDKIGAHDHFIRLGLNSLLAMDVIARCSSDLHVVLYPKDVLERPCIHQLVPLLISRLGRDTEMEPGTRALDFFGWRVSHAKQTAPSDAAPKNGPVIFLLSAPRSGSTLLRVMLAGHTRLFCPPELHLLPYNTLGEREVALGDTGLGEGLSSALRALFQETGDSAALLAESWRKENLAVTEVYKRLQNAAAPRVLVDKSPTYAGAREILERAEVVFKAPLYIYLTRHPYAVMESFVRTGMERYLSTRASDPYETAELAWSVSNRNLSEFLKSVPDSRKRCLHYEYLVATPRQALEELCSFLGVTFEESLLYPYQGERMTQGLLGTAPAVGDPNFLKHSAILSELGEAWRHIRLPRALSPSTVSLANVLGYALPETTQSTLGADFEESRL